MRKLLLWMSCLALAACAAQRPTLAPHSLPWERRQAILQRVARWQLTGRAAVAFGTQGWQATLDWRQDGAASDVHLAGPLGVGAMQLSRTAQGLSLNGAPPSDAMQALLRDKLGFELPLDELRYWLLGVPDPDSTAELLRNDEDRAQQITQAGWTVAYDRYLGVGDDVLPAHLVLSREGVRVRIAIDHWQAPR